MDQFTREQLLYAEAARHGVSPTQIHEAIRLVARAVQHDVAVHQQAMGRALTPDEWLDRHSPDIFRLMCRRAAQAVGLDAHQEDLVFTIVEAVVPFEDDPRDDDRPWQFQARPLTHPAEANFPAYTVAYQDPRTSPDSRPTSVIRSGARVRIALIRALRARLGAACLEEITGAVTFTYGGLPGVFIATPIPDPGHPQCSGCGQWDSEHDLPDGDSCALFQGSDTGTAHEAVPV
ncbi:hypothetical protein RCO28_18750 [Streptomyces sp. LHD-70]|uniref:hypothetical protein n=1 Tax=Streptomyces sp. LHD-70 TaxID=3072140 RepID=UPI00280C5217|nr:hypothetical protein [Streptomyces sp. LHD-70]MDQ8704512.1 hypothetical protein [Streptomyces sp. LHD-70]